MPNSYRLLFHVFFYERLMVLIHSVEKLYITLPPEDYKRHPLAKLLAHIVNAYSVIIPENPNHPDYYMKGKLSKFRRYKKGLQRNRLIFCFSNNPSIIVYLYLNDEAHLRKDGSKTDPYFEFSALVEKGVIGSTISDPMIKKWLKNKVL